MKKALRWIGGGLGVLVAAIAIVYVAGLAIDREHTAVVSAELSAPPERVFAAIADVEAYPRWREIDRVEVLSRDPLRWREEAGGDAITFEVVERVENERFVARIADPELPFGGTWTYVLEPRGGGTRLTITEDGWIDPPPFRLILKYVVGYDATQRAVLDRLRNHLR